MNIDQLTIKEAREIASLFTASQATPCDDSHWKVGKNYAIRTVTMMHTGKLVKVTDKEIILSDAAWIADTGRFEQAMESGDFSEVEMFPKDAELIVGRGALVDACQITKIPTSQK